MNDFKKYYNENTEPVAYSFSRDLEENILLILELKKYTEQLALPFVWHVDSPTSIRKMLLPFYRNQRYSHFKRIVAICDSPNGRRFIIKIISEGGGLYLKIEYPALNTTDYSKSVSLKDRLFNVDIYLLYVSLCTSSGKNEKIISLYPNLHGSPTDNIVPNLLKTITISFKIYKASLNAKPNDAASVIEAISNSDRGLTPTDIARLKIKHGVPISDNERTDDLLSSIT